MATILTLKQVNACRAGGETRFTAEVYNSAATAITVSDLVVSEVASSSQGGMTIAQPQFLTVGLPAASAAPSIAAGATGYYNFSVVFHGPNWQKLTPQHPGGGNRDSVNANGRYALRLQATTTDGVSAIVLGVTAAPSISNEPPAEGGTFDLVGPRNLVNFVTLLA